ncbi:1130_t:CDS:2 [Acaulospora morrowiae]|uniref:1130_t:CDS:1 n=1 Tax=Acaulospora morrowiae TaxID=94023 RepID=A0A9N8YR50_9GLOM|nr:1130_t:CDS:2 [Acaulospora morrowiae]
MKKVDPGENGESEEKEDPGENGESEEKEDPGEKGEPETRVLREKLLAKENLLPLLDDLLYNTVTWPFQYSGSLILLLAMNMI